jgi:hypothetical protein
VSQTASGLSSFVSGFPPHGAHTLRGGLLDFMLIPIMGQPHSMQVCQLIMLKFLSLSFPKAMIYPHKIWH